MRKGLHCLHVACTIACTIACTSWKQWNEIQNKIHIDGLVQGWGNSNALAMNFNEATIMTSSNGNIFRVTDPLCGEFTGDRWIPCTKASDAQLWRFLSWATNRDAGDLTRHRANMTSLQCNFLALTHRQGPWSDIQHLDGEINYGLATQPTYLGLWVNNYPSWYDHILKLFRKTYYHSHMFRRLRKIIPSPLLHNLWHIEVLRAIKDNI